MKSPDLFKDGTVLLYISKNAQRQRELVELLSDRFSFISSKTVEGGLVVLEEFGKKLAAVLIDEECGLEDGGAFFKAVSNSVALTSLAIIVVCYEQPRDGGRACLALGAQDFILPPFHTGIVAHRIQNAIRAMDSLSFREMERILKELPSNIYLKDEEGRYVFCTQYWHHIEHGNDPNWTIRGKSDIEIRKDRENAIEAMKADMELLKTGVGTDYTIEINVNGVQEFMEVIKRPVRDAKGRITGIVGLINDVTQKELLKLRLQEASTTDGLTGILNRGTIHSFISDALQSFQENGGRVSLLMFDLDNFKQVNDTYGHQGGDAVLIAFADILRNTRAGSFKAGRWGGEEFMVLLYDTDLSEAVSTGEQLRQRFADTRFPGMRPQTVSVGAAQANPEDSTDSLCSRVDAALYRAKTSGKNKVVPL